MKTPVITTPKQESRIRFQVTYRTGACEVTYGAETIEGLMELRQKDKEFELRHAGVISGEPVSDSLIRAMEKQHYEHR